MRLWVLGSGSRGNAVLLEERGRRILIDAGFPPRTLAARLRTIDIAPESVSAVVLTHEHQDHACGAVAGARRWGWSVHATAGTLDACPEIASITSVELPRRGSADVAGFTVDTTPVPHDAAAPTAVCVTGESGVRIGVAYDLGMVPDATHAVFCDLDLLVVEANHDAALLWNGPYPPSVRTRIASARGHLDNEAAAEFARQCACPALAHVVLAHVSQTCNTGALAHDAVSSSLRNTRFRGRVTVSEQGVACGPFRPHAGRREPARQLSLFG